MSLARLRVISDGRWTAGFRSARRAAFSCGRVACSRGTPREHGVHARGATRRLPPSRRANGGSSPPGRTAAFVPRRKQPAGFPPSRECRASPITMVRDMPTHRRRPFQAVTDSRYAADRGTTDRAPSGSRSRGRTRWRAVLRCRLRAARLLQMHVRAAQGLCRRC